jgi:uncharacterized protein DUF6526
MADQSQTYKNHVRWFAPFHFFVLPVLFLSALNAIRHVWQNPTLSTGFALLVAVAILTLGVLSRVMALAVQDRVIRLEMRLRLRECLPADLRIRINDLTPRQLVALRFASDAELAEMMRDVLAGKLGTEREIKMRVKDWQGDFLRA